MYDQLDQAIYTTVHSYKGGAVKLAPRIGVHAGTLSNKANPAMESHALNLRESIPLQIVANNFSILHAYAASLNHCAVPTGQFEGVSDTELLDLYAQYHANVGRMAETIREALADHRITGDEIRRIRTAGDTALRTQFELFNRLESLTDAI